MGPDAAGLAGLPPTGFPSWGKTDPQETAGCAIDQTQSMHMSRYSAKEKVT